MNDQVGSPRQHAPPFGRALIDVRDPCGSDKQLRAVYRADDLDAARVALGEFYDAAAAAGIPECDRLARTIRRWEAAVLAYYTTDGLSNAKTERSTR